MTACLVCGDPATSGLNLDGKCLDLLAQDIATCARLHAELEAVLVGGSRDGDGVRTTRGVSTGIGLDPKAVIARDHIRAEMTAWVRICQEERPASPWPADTIADCARYLLRNLTWIAARPWVQEFARMMAETCDEAKDAAAERPKRIEIGHCPVRLTDEEGQDAGACSGLLYSIVWPSGSLLPRLIRCTTADHEWTADQWHALGRRVVSDARATRDAAS